MSLINIHSFLVATCFGHAWATIRQHLLLGRPLCTVHFVFHALRHIIVFVVNFFRRIYPSYLFGAISVFFMLFTFVVYALVLSSPDDGPCVAETCSNKE
jgi:hypothetical protein